MFIRSFHKTDLDEPRSKKTFARRSAGELRRGSFVAGLLLSACLPTSLFAEGGAGGVSFGGQSGGAGGTGPNGASGSAGVSNIVQDGGGGGGGGSVSGNFSGGNGGAGGDGLTGSGAAGGAGGTAVSPDGAIGGTSTTGAGAGGGGGGYAGYNGTFNNASNAASGGLGGAGGDQTTSNDGGAAGGGGEGGYGAVVSVSGASANSGTLRGGTGGNGGQSQSGGGGSGGDGGVGAFFGAASSTFTNTGTLSGGDGGAAGIAGVDVNSGISGINGDGGSGGAGVVGARLTILNDGGTISGGGGGIAAGGEGGGGPGDGGIGIEGSNLTISNANGNISGGLSGDGSTQAAAIVFTGGVNYVGGAGAINGGINVLGGSFQPALRESAVGTPLTVTGPLFFAPGTFYNVRITPTANDSVVATGDATLTGATVKVVAGAGTYSVRQYTILSSNTLNGTTFAGVTSNLAFLRPTLTYDAGFVYLNISAGTSDTNPGGIDYRTAARTQNQRSVATGFTNAGNQNGDTGSILNALNQLTVPQAQAAFDNLSGEGIIVTQNLAFRSAQLFNSAIFDQTTFYGSGSAGNSITLTSAPPAFVALAGDGQGQRQPIHELADVPSSSHQPVMPVLPNRTWRAWGTGFGASEDIHGNDTIGSAEQNNTIYGGALGVDYQLMPNYLVGIAVGGSSGQFSAPGRTTSGSTDGGHIAFYDLATFGSFYGASSTSFSYYSNRTTRFVSGFGGLGSETERGNFGSDQFRTRLEFGRHLDGLGLGALGPITPFVALEIAQLRSNGFNESSITGPGNFRLNVSGQSIASAPGYVGARFQRVTPIGGGMVFSPTLQLAYIHEFAPERSQIGTLVDLPGSTFLVDGARPSRNAGEAKVGGELKIGASSVIFANFDGEFSGVDQLYAGKGGFRYLW